MPRRLARQASKINTNVLAVNIATLLLIFATFLSNYVNSSYLTQFISSESVGMIYTVGSALSILTLLFISRVLHKIGNYRATLAFVLIDIVCLVGMGFAESLRVAIPLFITHLALVNLVFFNFDIFMEEAIGQSESSTGSRRGLLLATSSFVGAATPLLSGVLVGEADSYATVYLLGALALTPILLLVFFRFKTIDTKRQSEVQILSAIRSFWVQRDIRFVFLSNLLLWFFFCYMVVYTPLYLSSILEFSWTQIGLILFGAQLAYTLIEFPAGHIADNYIGEKEMMAVGFLVISVSSAALSFLPGGSIWPWILVMFITRVGASLIEVTTESYFFKHTKGHDGQVISFFRMANPVAYILGPLTASLALLYLPFNLIFVVLGLLMVPGLFFTMQLHDTK